MYDFLEGQDATPRVYSVSNDWRIQLSVHRLAFTVKLS